MSIAANHDVAFVLDLQSMTYATLPRPPVVLPRDITLSFERAQDVLRGPADARLIFYPSGGSSGGRILLSSAQGRVSVTVDWLTGSVAVTQEPL